MAAKQWSGQINDQIATFQDRHFTRCCCEVEIYKKKLSANFLYPATPNNLPSLKKNCYSSKLTSTQPNVLCTQPPVNTHLDCVVYTHLDCCIVEERESADDTKQPRQCVNVEVRVQTVLALCQAVAHLVAVVISGRHLQTGKEHQILIQIKRFVGKSF